MSLPVDMFETVTLYGKTGHIGCKNSLDLINAALDGGGSPNAVNEQGMSLLIFVTRFHYDDTVIRLLVKRGADTRTTFENKTFVQWVGYRGDLIGMVSLAKSFGIRASMSDRLPLSDELRKREEQFWAAAVAAKV